MRQLSSSFVVVVLAALVAGIGGCRSSETNLTGPSGSKCSITLSYTGGVLVAAGGNGSVGVNTGRECTWTAAASVAWITVSTANGQGPTTVPFTFAANTATTQRQGAITVAGQSITLTQAAAACQYAIAPSSANVGAPATSVSVSVSTTANCSWTAASNAGFLTVSGGGSGDGTVTVSVAENTATQSRTGTATIAGQTFTVTQAGSTPLPTACSYSISPSSTSVGAGGGSGSFNLTTASTCEWSASSNASWIAVTSAGSGSGGTTVNYSVSSNTGPARSGAIVVAGLTFTVSQASGVVAPTCSYSVSPTTRAFDAGGGNSSVSVTAGSGCDWTASSSASWIRVTGGSSGTGNGTVNFSVDPTNGGNRTGTLSVAGQTVTVTQTGCTYSIAPTSTSVGASGGPGSVSVTATSGCSWSATSNDTWITITGGNSGTGAGAVSYSVGANTGGARSGTITVAGQVFTVNQAAAPAPTCTYSIAPLSATVGGSGGTGTVDVTTQAGCAWTASSNAPWVSISSGATGSGSGRVDYTAAANPSGAAGGRAATLTIAGSNVTLTFTLTQDPATCALSVSANSTTFPAAGGSGSISVTATAGCQWVASSGAPWLGIASGSASGSGNGTISFTVATNNTGATRSGPINISIGSLLRTVTIDQQ